MFRSSLSRLPVLAAVTLGAAGLGAIITALPASAASGTCTAGGGQITCTFTETGGAQLFMVPDGVSSINVAAYGAQGGTGSASAGGLGGEAQASFAVDPGDPVEVLVGGQGGGYLNGGSGGFNGGGAGGAGMDSGGLGGAGGGGASDVRLGSCASTLNCKLAARALVGGGGGGSVEGGGGFSGAGGYGGSPADGGAEAGAGYINDGLGGGGGSQTAGGTSGGASIYCPTAQSGEAGGTPTQDSGGPGGNGGPDGSGNGGGGGGGGYWGGGGGGGGCRGGIGGAGGGGSSYGPAGTTFNNGVQAGNGQVTISYTAPVITKIQPDQGPFFGATPVLITGTGLSCRAGDRSCTVTVTFGGSRAQVLLDRPTKIWVLSPAGSGTETVTVTVGGVSSLSTAATTFTYLRFL